MNAVAQRAGVSLMTVSNVINDKESVQAKTRALVMTAIEELGYRPNAAARTLASAAPKDIGLMYLNYENAFLSSLLLGALRGVGSAHAQLMVQEHHDMSPDTMLKGIDQLVRRGAKGIILPAPAIEFIDEPKYAEQIPVPVIGICPGDPLECYPSVRIDDRLAMRDMTAVMIGRGHRRIGFIRPPRHFLIGKSRFEGYVMALEAAGIAFDPSLVFDSDLSFDSGLEAGRYLLGLAERPSAIVSCNDDMAAAVISVAHRAGLSVPADLSVSGFNDGPIAHKIWPALATVRQPVSAAAERATFLLIETMGAAAENCTDGPDLATEYLPYEIMIRDSVADMTVHGA